MSEDLWDSGPTEPPVPVGSGADTLHGGHDADDEEEPPGWLGDERLFTAPAKALAAIVTGGASLLVSVTGGAIAQLVELDTRSTKTIAIEPGVELFLALSGVILSLLALRDLVDQQHPWAGTVARAALIVSGIGVLIGLVGVLFALTFHPSGTG